MRKTIVTLLTILSLSLVPASALSGTVAAACSDPNSANPDTSAKGQVESGIAQTGGTCDDSQLTNTVSAVVTILSTVIGIVAVIAILSAGFKYITSGGESSKVSNAKSTIVYALIGLFIAAVAQLLVHFVLYQTTKT
jgi:hypothetical protein